MWAQALGRAPAGSVPAKAGKGEAAAAAAQIQLGCDVQAGAGQLLQLLFEVHSCKLLLDPMVVANAVRRYETCWLPLVAAHAATRARSVIAPPLDVAWVWLLHALDPVHYAEDMARVLSKAVMRWWPDEMVPQNRPPGAVAEARRLWEAAQLYEPFDVTGQVAAKYGAMKAFLDKIGHASQLGTDFQAASAALADFMYQVALPHYREAWFLARAAQRYRRFLHLHRLHGRTTLIPPPDIDLCWRTHQVSHVAYSADSMTLFGDIYLRDDEQLNWKPGMLEFNFHLTEELYRAAYGEPLAADGSMFRGTPPPQWRIDPNPGEAQWEGAPCNAEHGALVLPTGGAAWGFTLIEGGPILDTWPPLPEDGVLIVMRAGRGGPFDRAMSLVMHYSGNSFDTASVMVLDLEGTVFATGQLVGSEQLPVRALQGGRGAGGAPSLAGVPGERAFSIAGQDRDWGIAVAIPRPGDPARPLTGDEKKDAKAGGMHLRLFRRGASDGSQTPFRWTRTTLPDAGVLWELLHGMPKAKGLLGKSKRPPSHPCDVSITIGPQGIPAQVVCGPAEDCGVALALAGALALQRTILTLSGVGGLLRSVSTTDNSSPRVPEGFKLLSEDQLFSLARARMQFPRGRRSTPQRPSRDGTLSAATSSAASSPARAPNPLAAPVQPPPSPLPCAGFDVHHLLRDHARDPPLTSRSVASSFGFSSAVAPSVALPPMTPGRRGEAPPPAAASTIVAGIRAQEWGAMGVPLAAVEVLGSEDGAVLSFLDALRTGADDDEVAARRRALLTKAAPELNPGLNPGLDPTCDLPSPRTRKSFVIADSAPSMAVSSPSLSPLSEEQQRQQHSAPQTPPLQQPLQPQVQQSGAQAAAQKQLAATPPSHGPERSAPIRRSLSFDTGQKSAELHPLKPLTEQPGHDHPRPSEEYLLHRGGDGTRLSPRERHSPRSYSQQPTASVSPTTMRSAMADAHLGSPPHIPRSPRAAALAAETAAALHKAERSEAAWIRAEPSAHHHSGRSPHHSVAHSSLFSSSAADSPSKASLASSSASPSKAEKGNKPAKVRHSRSAERDSATAALAAAAAAAGAGKSALVMGTIPAAAALDNRPVWRSGDSDTSTAKGGSGSSGSSPERRRHLNRHASSGALATGSLKGEANSSAASSQAGVESVAPTEITLSPRPEDLPLGVASPARVRRLRRGSPDAVALLAGGLPSPVPEERSSAEMQFAPSAHERASINAPEPGSSVSLTPHRRGSTSENDKEDYKHPAVVVEQYAPVSSARDRFNKADDKPLTPRNSWGGGSGDKEGPGSASRGGSGQLSNGFTPRSPAAAASPRDGSPLTGRSPRHPAAVAADSLLAEASATLLSVHEMANRTPRTSSGRLLSSRSMPAAEAEQLPSPPLPASVHAPVDADSLPQRPATLRGSTSGGNLRSALSDPAAVTAVLQEPMPPRPPSSAGGSPAGGSSPLRRRASPAAGGSPMHAAAPGSAFGTAASAEALLNGIRTLAADVEAAEVAEGHGGSPAKVSSPSSGHKHRSRSSKSSRITDWEARTSQRPEAVPRLGLEGSKRRGGGPGVGQQFETLESLRTKFAGPKA